MIQILGLLKTITAGPSTTFFFFFLFFEVCRCLQQVYNAVPLLTVLYHIAQLISKTNQKPKCNKKN